MGKIVKRVLFALMPDGYKDAEFLEPYNIIKNSGHNVEVAGFKPGLCLGSDGHKQKPELELFNIAVNDFDHYDALVIPGGPSSPQYLWENDDLQEIVRYFHENGKIVAAICWACVVPAQAGILQGKHATVYPSDDALSIFEQNKVHYVDEECVVLTKEHIITSPGPKYATTFGNAIVNLLE